MVGIFSFPAFVVLSMSLKKWDTGFRSMNYVDAWELSSGFDVAPGFGFGRIHQNSSKVFQPRVSSGVVVLALARLVSDPDLLSSLLLGFVNQGSGYHLVVFAVVVPSIQSPGLWI